MGAPVKTESLKKCSDLCKADLKCFAWTYLTSQYENEESQGDCTMKGERFMEGRETTIGATSGTSNKRVKELYCKNESKYTLTSFYSAI